MTEQLKVPPEWFEHVATLRLRKHLLEIRGFAVNALMVAAAQSTDPKIRQLHASCSVLEDMIKMVTPDPKASEDDDDGPESDHSSEE
jgi:hypothetical protein